LGSHRKLKKIKDYKLIPPMVFMWWRVSSIKNRFGMMNIGFNPTVSEKNIDRNPFFDFDADLYDQK
jgi:FAD synthase